MFLDPLGAIAALITGKLAVDRAGKIADKTIGEADLWWRFGMSLFVTAFCSFFGTWGATTPPLIAGGTNVWVALVLGFCAGLVIMSAMVYSMWVRSPLTKGMSLMIPTSIARKAEETDSTLTEK